jgi:hypothetical protein
MLVPSIRLSRDESGLSYKIYDTRLTDPNQRQTLPFFAISVEFLKKKTESPMRMPRLSAAILFGLLVGVVEAAIPIDYFDDLTLRYTC